MQSGLVAPADVCHRARAVLHVRRVEPAPFLGLRSTRLGPCPASQASSPSQKQAPSIQPVFLLSYTHTPPTHTTSHAMFGKSKARKEADRKLALEEDERRWGSKVYGDGANKTLDQLVAEKRALNAGSGESLPSIHLYLLRPWLTVCRAQARTLPRRHWLRRPAQRAGRNKPGESGETRGLHRPSKQSTSDNNTSTHSVNRQTGSRATRRSS